MHKRLVALPSTQRTVRRPRSTGEAAAANTWYTAPYTALSDAEDTITNQSPNAP